MEPDAVTKPPQSRLGRPTKAQQIERADELLNAALDIFLDRGFENTTMEGIATSLGMSKRTIYTKYDDKTALFNAAVRCAIDRVAMPRKALEDVECSDLETTLCNVARLRAANASAPQAVKLQRIFSAQAYRFPEMFQLSFQEVSGPTIGFLVDLFSKRAQAGEIAHLDYHRAAVAFLSITVGGISRLAISGVQMEEAEFEATLSFGVRLFLDGARRQ